MKVVTYPSAVCPLIRIPLADWATMVYVRVDDGYPEHGVSLWHGPVGGPRAERATRTPRRGLPRSTEHRA